MKRIMVSAVLVLTAMTVLAQDEGDKGFKKENLFTGGSLTLSFYSGGLIVGGNPMFGYKLANWADAGISLNYVYSESRDNFVINDRLSQNVLGPGVFARLYPFRFFYVEGQYEHNFMNQKYSDPSSGYSSSVKADANSLLVGGGIAEGRQRGSNTFFYISLLFDVLKNPNSPYVNNVYEGNVLVRSDAIPILRAGVNIGLFQGKKNKSEERGDGHRQPRNYNNL